MVVSACTPMFLIFYTFLVISINADIRKCFTAHKNIKISCGEPFEKRNELTYNECGVLCAKMEEHCLTAQYDHFLKSCDIFNTESPLGNDNRTKRDISPRQVDENCHLISLQPTIGTTHLVPIRSCLTEYLKDAFKEETREPLKDSLNVRPIKTNVLSNTDGQAAIEVVPVLPDCPIGESARAQIIEGVQVDSVSTVTFIAQSSEHCFHGCKTNSYPSGERLPLLCRSADFNKSTKKCSTFPDAVNPNGFLEYTPNNQVVYMEKICMPETVISPVCNDSFRRIPQHVIMGHASDILSVASEQECIMECIRAKLNKHLNCQSIMHFPDFSVQNCILNVHTRHTRNPFFTPELIFKVDYVEISPCSIKPKSLIHEEPKNRSVPVSLEWTEWTECNEKTSTRSRFKYCEGCKEIVQFLPCFSNNNFDKAVQTFINEEQHKQAVNDKHKILNFPELQSGPSLSDMQFFGPPINEKSTN